MSGINEVRRPELGVTPGGPRDFPAGPDDSFRQRRNYSTHVYTPEIIGGVITPRDKTFSANGDHLTVLEIEGADLLAVQIGADDNGFIPVRAGDVIMRPFDRFKVRNMNYVNPGGAGFMPGVTHALFAASYGPLIDRKPPRTGMRAGFRPFSLVADATGVDILSGADFAASLGLTLPMQILSWLRYGGTMRIHNRSATTSVFLYYDNPSSPLLPAAPATLDMCAWEILPGQKEHFDFDSGVRFLERVDPADRTTCAGTIFLRTLAGTATCSVLVNQVSWDASDPDSLPPSLASMPRSIPWGARS